MNTKHTPAPWKNTLTGIKDSTGNLIAQAWCGHSNDSFGNIPAVGYSEMKANARLIAAAPELLEALEMVFARVLELPECSIFSLDEQKKIASAIQKATQP